MSINRARVVSFLAIVLALGLFLLDRALLRGRGGAWLQVASFLLPVLVVSWAYGKVKPKA